MMRPSNALPAEAEEASWRFVMVCCWAGLPAVHQQCLGRDQQLKDQMHVILEDRIRVFIHPTNLPVVLVDQQKRGCPHSVLVF